MLALRAWAQPAEGGRGVRLSPWLYRGRRVPVGNLVQCRRALPTLSTRERSRRLSDEASGQGARRARLRRTRSAYTHPPTLCGLPYRCLSTLVRICQTRWPAGGVGAWWGCRVACTRKAMSELINQITPPYPAASGLAASRTSCRQPPSGATARRTATRARGAFR